MTVQRLSSKKFLIAWNVEKSLFDSRPTVAWTPTTVTWPFSVFFSKKFLIAWNVEKSLFDSRPMVAWPPTTLARHHILPRRCISRFYYSSSSIFPPKARPRISSHRNGPILEISKLGIGRREFLILAGKFQLVDSPWGEQVPHYKHRRRSITYLLREIPVKNRERWDRSQQTG